MTLVENEELLSPSVAVSSGAEGSGRAHQEISDSMPNGPDYGPSDGAPGPIRFGVNRPQSEGSKKIGRE
jgi:hypothetical protein